MARDAAKVHITSTKRKQQIRHTNGITWKTHYPSCDAMFKLSVGDYRCLFARKSARCDHKPRQHSDYYQQHHCKTLGEGLRTQCFGCNVTCLLVGILRGAVREEKGNGAKHQHARAGVTIFVALSLDWTRPRETITKPPMNGRQRRISRQGKLTFFSPTSGYEMMMLLLPWFMSQSRGWWAEDRGLTAKMVSTRTRVATKCAIAIAPRPLSFAPSFALSLLPVLRMALVGPTGRFVV
ncbi:hypothetical protein V8F33_001800 [Rhypophila sp. PSN 637]